MFDRSMNTVSSLTGGCRPTVVKMNAFAPQHSRLFKEVIVAYDWLFG